MPANPERITGVPSQGMLDSLDGLRFHERLADPETRARIAMYEWAFRMQTSVPHLLGRPGAPDADQPETSDPRAIDHLKRWIAAGRRQGSLRQTHKGPRALVYLSEYIPAVTRSSATSTGFGLVRVSGAPSSERSEEQVFRSALTPEGLAWFDTLKDSSAAMITKDDVVDLFKNDALDKTFIPTKRVLYFVVLPGAKKSFRLLDFLTERVSISATGGAAELFFGLDDERN